MNPSTGKVQHVFGYGLVQPLQRIAGKDFVAGGEDLLIGASIRQLLGTRPGELRWAPEFGVNLDQYRHRGGTEGLADVAADDVVEGIQEWIPAVSEAYADVTIDGATLSIKVTYKAISRNTPASNIALGPTNIEEEI